MHSRLYPRPEGLGFTRAEDKQSLKSEDFSLFKKKLYNYENIKTLEKMSMFDKFKYKYKRLITKMQKNEIKTQDAVDIYSMYLRFMNSDNNNNTQLNQQSEQTHHILS